MSRAATGNVYPSRGRWYARVSLGSGFTPPRPSFALPTCSTRKQALARLAVLLEFVDKLRAAGQIALAPQMLKDAAPLADGAPLEAARAALDQICTGARRLERATTAGDTMRTIGERWTSGELHRDHPDHVKAKRSARSDRTRLESYVYPKVDQVPIAAFTLDHAEAVMRALPSKLSAASRRHVAQLMHRILGMAVFPLRLLAANPLPRGFMPRIGDGKTTEQLYPDEDRKLLACSAKLLASPGVPLCYRVLYGFLAREGMRPSEAAALRWADVDLERGAVSLDENKTDSPRAWALDPGVVRALSRWRELRGGKKAGEHVFVDEQGAPLVRYVAIEGSKEKKPELTARADEYRAHLTAAGITRSKLHADSKVRRPTRIHDLRGLFVSTALANGRTEAWVSDRTGHTTSKMLNDYRQRARELSELALGVLLPLDVAIPELAPIGGAIGGTSGGKGKRRSKTPSKQGNRPRGGMADAVDLKAKRSPSVAPQAGTFPADSEGSDDVSQRVGASAANSPPIEPTLRTGIVAALAARLGELVAAGDVEGARVVTETIARLLGGQ